MIGFFTQNVRNLFVKSFSKQRHWADTLSILCVKIFEENCANIKIFSETRTKLKTTAVVICDAGKIYAK